MARLKAAVIVIAVLASGFASAQQLPYNPKPLKTIILLTLLHAGAAGADAYYTHLNTSQTHWHETDPLARPFVGSTAGCVAFFSVDVAAHASVALLLHKHHHHNLAIGVLAGGIAWNTDGAAFSATHEHLQPSQPLTSIRPSANNRP